MSSSSRHTSSRHTSQNTSTDELGNSEFLNVLRAREPRSDAEVQRLVDMSRGRPWDVRNRHVLRARDVLRALRQRPTTDMTNNRFLCIMRIREPRSNEEVNRLRALERGWPWPPRERQRRFSPEQVHYQTRAAEIMRALRRLQEERNARRN